jgi:hypothetical protein
MDICLVYFSSTVKPFQEEDLINILQHSRSHNNKVGITGLLLYVRGNVIQVLEGEQQAVESLYKRIEQDARHTNVSLAINRPIHQRLFPKWAMGYETISHQQLEEIRTVVNLERAKASPLILSENPIYRTLQAFYDGNRRN